jgi:hypothetical protein
MLKVINFIFYMFIIFLQLRKKSISIFSTFSTFYNFVRKVEQKTLVTKQEIKDTIFIILLLYNIFKNVFTYFNNK